MLKSLRAYPRTQREWHFQTVLRRAVKLNGDVLAEVLGKSQPDQHQQQTTRFRHHMGRRQSACAARLTLPCREATNARGTLPNQKIGPVNIAVIVNIAGKQCVGDASPGDAVILNA